MPQPEQTIAEQKAAAQQRHQERQTLVGQYPQQPVRRQAEVQEIREEVRRQAEETGRPILPQAHPNADLDSQRPVVTF